MKEKIYNWLDKVLQQDIPKKTKGLNFNLYDDSGDNWSIELVATTRFDLNDEDWACDEFFDFGTRKKPLKWKQNAKWDIILDEIKQILQDYLNDGDKADILKEYDGVGVGFVDGNTNVIFSK